MNNAELNNFVVLEQTQKDITAQYERNQILHKVSRQKARALLRQSTSDDQAIFELDGKYYRLFIDSDDDIQVEIIHKIS